MGHRMTLLPTVPGSGNQVGSQSDQQDVATTTTNVSQSGVINATGLAPDPSTLAKLSGQTPTVVGFSALIDSLQEMAGPGGADSDKILAELAAIKDKLKQTLGKTDDDQVNVEEQKKQAALQEEKAQNDKSTKSLKDAQAAQASESIGDKIKLAFECIGAVLAVVVAVALIATGVGAVAGAFLLAGAAVAIALAVDGVVKEATPDHLGIMGSIVHAAGGSLAEAQKGDMGFELALSGVALICGGVTMFLNPEGTASAIASTVANVSKIAEGVSDVGMAGSTVSSSVYSYQATGDQADATKAQAQVKYIQASMTELDNQIDAAINALSQMMQGFNQSTGSLMDAIKAHVQSLHQFQPA